MSAYLRSTTYSHSTLTSNQATDYQLKVEVPGITGVDGVTHRFEADDSLSLFQIHCVGVVTISNPIILSLQHNCTVFRVELQTP